MARSLAHEPRAREDACGVRAVRGRTRRARDSSLEDRQADMPRLGWRMEIQVGEGPRIASRRLREALFRRLRLGDDQGAVLVAGIRRERQGRLGHRALHECPLSVQVQSAIRDGRAAEGVHELRRAQPRGLVQTRLRSACLLEGRPRVPQVRRRRFVLLPLGEREVRGLHQGQPLRRRV